MIKTNEINTRDLSLLEEFHECRKISDEDIIIIRELFYTFTEIYFTGSMRFGVKFPKDIDLFLFSSKEYMAHFLSPKLEPEAEVKGSLGSIRFKNSAINIICLQEKDVESWKVATQMMSTIEPIELKIVRVGIFEILKSIAKMHKLIKKNKET